MNESRALPWLVWGFLAVIVAAITGLFVVQRLQERHPPLPEYGSVSAFSLTNQAGGVVSLEDLRGKIWLADIIFTRCAGPCARMTRQMRTVQKQFADDGSVVFLSFTADPQYDTPKVLREYAGRFEANASNWHFLTGPKEEIYRLSTNDLKFVVIENELAKSDPNEDLFIHSTKFVLVDGRGTIRAYFDGAEPSASEEVVEAIKRLRKEKRS